MKSTNMRFDSRILATALILAMIALTGCSQMSSQSVTSNSDKSAQILIHETDDHSQAINEYFLSLNSWDKVSPAQEDSNTLKSTQKNIVKASMDEAPQTCLSQEYSMVKTPEKIVMQNPAVEILYPGALIQGEGYMQGPGGVRELPIRQRAPMTIAIDLVSEKSMTVINDINYANYQQAYTQLIRGAMAQGILSQGNISFNQVEVQKSEQAALDLGFSVKYLGQSLNGELHTKSDLKENTFMVVFEHRAFTISAVAPSSPAGFFSSDLKVEDLKSQEAFGNIGEKNPPLYVSNVSYGRILMFTVTSKASKSDIKGALNAMYNNLATQANGDLKAEQHKVLNEATVKVISIGGNTAQTEALIRSGNLKEYFEAAPNLDAYVPLSYTFRNIRDNSLATVAEATNYTKVECTPVPVKAYKVKVSLESLLVKRGLNMDFVRKAYIYGTIHLNDKLVWNHPKRSEYIIMRRDQPFVFNSERDQVEVEIPVNNKNVNLVTVKVDLKDNASPAFGIPAFTSESIADDVLTIGLTKDGKVLAAGKYTEQNSYYDITYSVSKPVPVYETQATNGGEW